MASFVYGAGLLVLAAVALSVLYLATHARRWGSLARFGWVNSEAREQVPCKKCEGNGVLTIVAGKAQPSSWLYKHVMRPGGLIVPGNTADCPDCTGLGWSWRLKKNQDQPS